MAILTNFAPASSYAGLMNLVNTTGLTPALQVIQDGFGNNTTISVSTTQTNVGGTFSISGTPLTATASQINSVCSNFSFLATAQPIVLPQLTNAQAALVVTNGTLWYNTTQNRIQAYANGALHFLTP